MDGGDDKLQVRRGPAAGRAGRGDRLAAALRTNLVKRKEQGRARARRSAAAAAMNDPGDARAVTPERPPRGGQSAQPPHDSAEFVTDKPAG